MRVRCFNAGCAFSGDALHLVAEVRGLDIRRDFREVLRVAAEVAHRWDIARELVPRTTSYRMSAAPSPFLARKNRDSGRTFCYPPTTELSALWRACTPCSEDEEVSTLLASRRISGKIVDSLDLARALPLDARLPPWARFRGARPRSEWWTKTGHRLLLPVYDPFGRMRSVRAWCVRESDDPKRLPPSGYCARGLLLACGVGVAMLARGGRANQAPPRSRIVVVEGEPDFLTWATRFSDADEDAPAVFGVLSGAWSDDFALRVPDGSRVLIRTHHDSAGHAYARDVTESLNGRCAVLRARSADAAR